MGETKHSKKLSYAQETVKGLETAYASTYFIFFSNVGGTLKDIFSRISDAFQITSFVLSGILFLFDTAKFALAPNKSIGKWGNWLWGVLKLALLGLATFGAVVFGAAAVTIILSVSTAADLLLDLVRSIYFAIQSGREKDPEDRQLAREEASDAAGRLIIVGIGVIILILIVMAPHFLGISLIAALGIGAGVFLAAVGIAAIVGAIYKTFYNPPNVVTEQNDSTYEKLIPLLEARNVSKVSLTETAKLPEKEGYYAYSMLKPNYSVGQIFGLIEAQKNQLASEIAEDKKNDSFVSRLFSQEEKRTNKIEALELLEQLLLKIRSGEIYSDGGTVTFNLNEEEFVEFKYQTPADLKQQFNDYIVKEFPGVFESLLRDVGKTHHIFAHVYRLLGDNQYMLSSSVEMQHMGDIEESSKDKVEGEGEKSKVEQRPL